MKILEQKHVYLTIKATEKHRHTQMYTQTHTYTCTETQTHIRIPNKFNLKKLKKIRWLRDYGHWLLLKKAGIWFLAHNDRSQLSTTSSKDPMSSDEFPEHQGHMWCTYAHTCKAAIHVK